MGWIDRAGVEPAAGVERERGRPVAVRVVGCRCVEVDAAAGRKGVRRWARGVGRGDEDLGGGVDHFRDEDDAWEEAKGFVLGGKREEF